MSVWLNGEQVVDNVIMENYWDRSQPIPAIDQIELQRTVHALITATSTSTSCPAPHRTNFRPKSRKEGFKVLFDGTNMHEWIGNTRDYVSNDGMISLVPHEGS